MANDDKEQFLGAAFVNNPAIAIPENDLGLAYRREAGLRAPGFTLLAMASEYAPADSVQPAQGLFLAAEAFRQVGAVLARFGGWTVNRSLRSRRGVELGANESGIYASLDGKVSGLSWNLRAGKAFLARADRETYIGASLLFPIRQSDLGFGIGHSVRKGNALSGWHGGSD